MRRAAKYQCQANSNLCNGHGACTTSGSCACTGGYTGSYCSYAPMAVDTPEGCTCKDAATCWTNAPHSGRRWCETYTSGCDYTWDYCLSRAGTTSSSSALRASSTSTSTFHVELELLVDYKVYAALGQDSTELTNRMVSLVHSSNALFSTVSLLLKTFLSRTKCFSTTYHGTAVAFSRNPHSAYHIPHSRVPSTQLYPPL